MGSALGSLCISASCERNVPGPCRRVSCLEELSLGWPALAPGRAPRFRGRGRGQEASGAGGAAGRCPGARLLDPPAWTRPGPGPSLRPHSVSLLACALAATRCLQSCLHKSDHQRAARPTVLSWRAGAANVSPPSLPRGLSSSHFFRRKVPQIQGCAMQEVRVQSPQGVQEVGRLPGARRAPSSQTQLTGQIFWLVKSIQRRQSV